MNAKGNSARHGQLPLDFSKPVPAEAASDSRRTESRVLRFRPASAAPTSAEAEARELLLRRAAKLTW